MLKSNENIYQFFYLTKKEFPDLLWNQHPGFLFILFFQPFAVEKIEFDNKLLFFAGFGLIILISLLLNQIIFHALLIQADRDEANDPLQFSLYFFSLILTTSLAFIFYIRYVGQERISFNTVVMVIFICASLQVILYLNTSLNSYQYR